MLDDYLKSSNVPLGLNVVVQEPLAYSMLKHAENQEVSWQFSSLTYSSGQTFSQIIFKMFLGQMCNLFYRLEKQYIFGSLLFVLYQRVD